MCQDLNINSVSRKVCSLKLQLKLKCWKNIFHKTTLDLKIDSFNTPMRMTSATSPVVYSLFALLVL